MRLKGEVMRKFLAVLVILVGSLAALTGTSAASPYRSGCSVSPLSAPAGTTVTVSGTVHKSAVVVNWYTADGGLHLVDTVPVVNGTWSIDEPTTVAGENQAEIFTTNGSRLAICDSWST